MFMIEKLVMRRAVRTRRSKLGLYLILGLSCIKEAVMSKMMTAVDSSLFSQMHIDNILRIIINHHS